MGTLIIGIGRLGREAADLLCGETCCGEERLTALAGDQAGWSRLSSEDESLLPLSWLEQATRASSIGIALDPNEMPAAQLLPLVIEQIQTKAPPSNALEHRPMFILASCPFYRDGCPVDGGASASWLTWLSEALDPDGVDLDTCPSPAELESNPLLLDKTGSSVESGSLPGRIGLDGVLLLRDQHAGGGSSWPPVAFASEALRASPALVQQIGNQKSRLDSQGFWGNFTIVDVAPQPGLLLGHLLRTFLLQYASTSAQDDSSPADTPFEGDSSADREAGQPPPVTTGFPPADFVKDRTNSATEASLRKLSHPKGGLTQALADETGLRRWLDDLTEMLGQSQACLSDQLKRHDSRHLLARLLSWRRRRRLIKNLAGVSTQTQEMREPARTADGLQATLHAVDSQLRRLLERLPDLSPTNSDGQPPAYREATDRLFDQLADHFERAAREAHARHQTDWPIRDADLFAEVRRHLAAVLRTTEGPIVTWTDNIIRMVNDLGKRITRHAPEPQNSRAQVRWRILVPEWLELPEEEQVGSQLPLFAAVAPVHCRGLLPLATMRLASGLNLPGALSFLAAEAGAPSSLAEAAELEEATRQSFQQVAGLLLSTLALDPNRHKYSGMGRFLRFERRGYLEIPEPCALPASLRLATGILLRDEEHLETLHDEWRRGVAALPFDEVIVRAQDILQKWMSALGLNRPDWPCNSQIEFGARSIESFLQGQPKAPAKVQISHVPSMSGERAVPEPRPVFRRADSPNLQGLSYPIDGVYCGICDRFLTDNAQTAPPRCPEGCA